MAPLQKLSRYLLVGILSTSAIDMHSNGKRLATNLTRQTGVVASHAKSHKQQRGMINVVSDDIEEGYEKTTVGVELVADDIEEGYVSTQSFLHPWIQPLSVSAVVTTVALQLSPMPSSLEIRAARDVKRYDGYPYFAVLAGATQWCIYGVAAAHYSGSMSYLTMVAANGPGIFFGLFYVNNFYRFAPPDDARVPALTSYLFVFGLFLLCQAFYVALYGPESVFYLGMLGSVGSAQIALSPFKTFPEVLKTRSTKSWQFDLCLWNFIQSFFTGSFGLSNHDKWVFFPNLIGVIAAVVQLTVIALFKENRILVQDGTKAEDANAPKRLSESNRRKSSSLDWWKLYNGANVTTSTHDNVDMC